MFGTCLIYHKTFKFASICEFASLQRLNRNLQVRRIELVYAGKLHHLLNAHLLHIRAVDERIVVKETVVVFPDWLVQLLTFIRKVSVYLRVDDDSCKQNFFAVTSDYGEVLHSRFIAFVQHAPFEPWSSTADNA